MRDEQKAKKNTLEYLKITPFWSEYEIEKEREREKERKKHWNMNKGEDWKIC